MKAKSGARTVSGLRVMIKPVSAGEDATEFSAVRI